MVRFYFRNAKNKGNLIFKFTLLIILLFSFLHGNTALGDPNDPFDPFDLFEPHELEELDDLIPDSEKTTEDLIGEALRLQMDDRPLDSRTKLLTALKKDPKAFKAHIMLADYYVRYVGHFRLALKYVKQAERLFWEQHGKPPYKGPTARLLHSEIIYLLSQVRLNLDDYQGALEAIKLYESYGYFSSWLPSSKSWILMKLGRLTEAIKVARAGILVGSNPGHVLNILGILLSMTGQRQASLATFARAIEFESALGPEGRPATPLNNSGEVYREIFREDNAKMSWNRSMMLPDGCEHVLPSLNLCMLYLEQNNFNAAAKAIDDFESCFAQYPLRNGEEHRALVHLARGRIAMHTGHIDSALEHFEGAMEKRQWFGKIGTNIEDLKAAVMMSLAQALTVKNNHLKVFRPLSFWGRLSLLKERASNLIRSLWLMRRARQLLTENLKSLEDLYIKHTDSMLEYHLLGDLLAGIPAKVLRRRIDFEQQEDRRPEALTYYKTYLAENYLRNGREKEGYKLLVEAERKARPVYDEALRTRIKFLKLRNLEPDDPEYSSLSTAIYMDTPAFVRNYGLKLPVNFSGTDVSARKELSKSALFIDSSSNSPITVFHRNESGKHIFQLQSNKINLEVKQVSAEKIEKAVNLLTEAVFER